MALNFVSFQSICYYGNMSFIFGTIMWKLIHLFCFKKLYFNLEIGFIFIFTFSQVYENFNGQILINLWNLKLNLTEIFWFPREFELNINNKLILLFDNQAICICLTYQIFFYYVILELRFNKIRQQLLEFNNLVIKRELFTVRI